MFEINFLKEKIIQVRALIAKIDNIGKFTGTKTLFFKKKYQFL